MAGYALYNTTDWTAAAAGYKNGTQLLTEAGAPEPLMFLPAAGVRDNSNGLVNEVGEFGNYATSITHQYYPNYMRFQSGQVQFLGGGSHYPACYGLSVRCIAE